MSFEPKPSMRLSAGDRIAIASLILGTSLPIIAILAGMWREQAIINHNDRRQDETLRDHETRIRTVEQATPVRRAANTPITEPGT